MNSDACTELSYISYSTYALSLKNGVRVVIIIYAIALEIERTNGVVGLGSRTFCCLLSNFSLTAVHLFVSGRHGRANSKVTVFKKMNSIQTNKE